MQMRPVGGITGGGIGVGLCEGLVTGARSRGTLSRRPEEWQHGKAINERKKLLREASKKHEKQCVAMKHQAHKQWHRIGCMAVWQLICYKWMLIMDVLYYMICICVYASLHM
jgi:hypothetical protein